MWTAGYNVLNAATIYEYSAEHCGLVPKTLSAHPNEHQRQRRGSKVWIVTSLWREGRPALARIVACPVCRIFKDAKQELEHEAGGVVSIG